MRYLFVFLFLICVLSCDKHKAKTYSGKYWCTVNSHYQSGAIGSDTTYNSELEVINDGKFIFVENKKFHVDSLKNGALFIQYSSPHDFSKIQIKDKSIYFYNYSGGLGGYGSIEYFGTKVN